MEQEIKLHGDTTYKLGRFTILLDNDSEELFIRDMTRSYSYINIHPLTDNAVKIISVNQTRTPEIIAPKNQLCGNFEKDSYFTSATICKNCGREKFLHPVPNTYFKGII